VLSQCSGHQWDHLIRASWEARSTISGFALMALLFTESCMVYETRENRDVTL